MEILATDLPLTTSPADPNIFEVVLTDVSVVTPTPFEKDYDSPTEKIQSTIAQELPSDVGETEEPKLTEMGKRAMPSVFLNKNVWSKIYSENF